MSHSKKNNGNGNGTEQIQVMAEGQYLIAGDLDYMTVPRIWNASQTVFANCRSLTIDLSGVLRSNSAGLALLIEWMRYAESTNSTIKFLNLPDQLAQVAQLCGVSDRLPV